MRRHCLSAIYDLPPALSCPVPGYFIDGTSLSNIKRNVFRNQAYILAFGRFHEVKNCLFVVIEEKGYINGID